MRKITAIATQSSQSAPQTGTMGGSPPMDRPVESRDDGDRDLGWLGLLGLAGLLGLRRKHHDDDRHEYNNRTGTVR